MKGRNGWACIKPHILTLVVLHQPCQECRFLVHSGFHGRTLLKYLSIQVLAVNIRAPYTKMWRCSGEIILILGRRSTAAVLTSGFAPKSLVLRSAAKNTFISK